MQVLFYSDPQLDGRHKMADHLDTLVREALGRFGDHITRVEAHVSEAGDHGAAKAGDITCTLEARLAGLPPVVVKHHAATAHQALHDGVAKLVRAVGSEIDKHEPRRGAARPAVVDAA